MTTARPQCDLKLRPGAPASGSYKKLARMTPGAWSLLILVVVAAGLQRVGAQVADDVATTASAYVTDADFSAVTDIPEATTIQDALTAAKSNSSEAMVVGAKESPGVSAADRQQGGLDLGQDAASRSLPVPVVVPLGHPSGLSVSAALPALNLDEDFMEDMQEIEQGSDMVMAERSAVTAVPVLEDLDQEDEVSDPLPPNHKKSSGDFSASDTNSLVGKQHRFVTAMPPDHDSEVKKYERMMAKLPVRDYPGYNVTGRDKPLDVVFVFPRVSEGNETRPRELEVVLVFPQVNATTTPAPAPPGNDPTDIGDEYDKLELASEKKETRENAPSHLNFNTIIPGNVKAEHTAPLSAAEVDVTTAATSTRTRNSSATSTTLVPSTAATSTPTSNSSATSTTLVPSTAATSTPTSTPSATSTTLVPSTATTSTPTSTPSATSTTLAATTAGSTTPATPSAGSTIAATTTAPVVHTPNPAFHRWKQEPGAYRQDIFKKYASKYASSRPPPVSFFRKDSGLAATRRSSGDDGDLDTGASDVQHVVLPAAASWTAGWTRAPTPVYIPARMQALRPLQPFPSLPPTGMQPMLIMMPPLSSRVPVMNASPQSQQVGDTSAATSPAALLEPLPETLPEALPEAVPQAQVQEVQPPRSGPEVRPVPVSRGRVRYDRPLHAVRPETSSTAQADHASEPSTTEGAHLVHLNRTQFRGRPLRIRAQTVDSPTTATTTAPGPAHTPRMRPRPSLLRPMVPTLETAVGAPPPQTRPAPASSHPIIRPLMALRKGTRRAPSSVGTAGDRQALTVEEAATIKEITALQAGQGAGELGPRGRMARLSSLQSRLVANLVAIQRELTERHAELRQHMDSLLLPAEHRSQGAARTYVDVRAPSAATAIPAAPIATTTTGPMRRRYRRPPALRKPAAPAEDKEQATRQHKVSYRTLYKKRAGLPTDKLKFGTTTTTTTTTITTPIAITTTESPEDMTTSTPAFDQQTVTEQLSVTTESVVESTTLTDVQEDPTVATGVHTETPATVTEALPTTETYESSTATPPSPTAEPEPSGFTDIPADITAEESAPAVASAPAPVPESAALTAALTTAQTSAQLPGAAEALRQDLLGFQPSPQDPVLRAGRAGRGSSRLTLLGGVLPEDDPAVAGGLFGLERHGRGAFRAPTHMEGGFVPMIPGSTVSLLHQPAGAPQIVGPIPGGYRDVLRGSPVQLDLPRAERPSDFLGRPAGPTSASASAARGPATASVPNPNPIPAAPPGLLPQHLIKRVMRVPLRSGAPVAPQRQG